MDKHGIGTDATHAEHIETIKNRNYIGLTDNDKLVPGKFYLVSKLFKIRNKFNS
jgi:DNA topoisomerase IA